MKNELTEVKKPIFCDLSVSERCNFRCKMCYMWKNIFCPEDVTIEQWKNCIISLEKFIEDNPRLFFIGGEPFLKEGFLEIIKFAKDKGFNTTVTSNGFLIDEGMARRISNAGLDSINLSLDSLNEKTHDFLRGINGSYKRMMKGIDHLSRYSDGLSITISAIILQQSLEDIIGLVQWVHKDKRLSSINFQAIQQPFHAEVNEPWQSDNKYSFLWPKDTTKVHNVIDELIAMKKAGYPINNCLQQLKNYKLYFENPQGVFREFNCKQSEKVIFVRANGDAFLCLSQSPIGNIKYQDIEDIWYSEMANSIREEIKHCTQNCNIAINCFFEERDNN